jgi:hypothetical protein
MFKFDISLIGMNYIHEKIYSSYSDHLTIQDQDKHSFLTAVVE